MMPATKHVRRPGAVASAWASAVLTSAFAAETATAQIFPPQEPATTRPSTSPTALDSDASRGDRFPGIQIDWAAPQVRVLGRIVLRDGPLEYFACFPGKEHESIVRLEAAPEHLYVALGLIGVWPGDAGEWNEDDGRWRPPHGDLVDVLVEIAGGDPIDASEWITEIEYGRRARPRSWVFAGSRRLPDDRLSAGLTGAGIALVDDPDSLLAMSRWYSSRNVELWAHANAALVPAEETEVQLLLRPAQWRSRRSRVDFRGAAFLDERYLDWGDLADWLRVQRRHVPEAVVEIECDGVLRTDLLRLRRTLSEHGADPDAYRFVPAAKGK